MQSLSRFLLSCSATTGRTENADEGDSGKVHLFVAKSKYQRMNTVGMILSFVCFSSPRQANADFKAQQSDPFLDTISEE